MKILALLILCTTLCAQEREDPEVRYVIRVHDAVVGYARTSERMVGWGKLAIQGETRLKLLQGGREVVRQSRRTTILMWNDDRPLYYTDEDVQDGEVSDYHLQSDGSKYVLQASLRGTPGKAEFGGESILGVLAYDAPEHFEIFLRCRRNKPGEFKGSVVVPEMMSALPINGTVFEPEDAQIAGTSLLATRVELRALGMLYRVWLDSNGALLRLEVPSQDFVAERTEKRLEELHLSAADLARSFSVPMRLAEGVKDLTVAAHSPGGVKEAKLRVHVKVGENKTDAEVLDNTRETFERAADSKEGWIDGTMTIGAREPKSEADVSPFLAKEDGIETDAPEIVALGKELIPDGMAPAEAAHNVCAWVNRHVEYDTRLVSALAAHQGKLGDCLSMARLTIAILRSRGIPARTIGGIALGGSGRLGQHHWVEVYLGAEKGWLQVDPTYGQCDGVDSFHLDLWRQGTLDGSADNWVELLSWEPAN